MQKARNHCHCPITDAIADEIAEASILYMATSKISSTPQKQDLTLYSSHMVDNLEGELYFYFTASQPCWPFRKEAHDILQSTSPLQGSVAAGVSHLNS